MRARTVRALQLYFVRNRWPRLYMSVIVLITGAAGFGASWALLHGGVVKMWLRYPLAVAIAYGVFLLLVRAWAELERARFDEDAALDEVLNPRDDRKPHSGTSRDLSDASDLGDWIDLSSFELDDGCLVGVAIAALIGLCAAIVAAVMSVISIAPILVAEVFLDAVLAAALYRRLRRIDRSSWFVSAIRHTWVPILITALCLLTAGLTMQALVPGAKSVGGVWRHYHPVPAPFQGDETPLERR
ncbi:MAG TPA: hypothetical protein VF614_11230 [Chthoniobacteraceae bacterium]